MYGDIELHPVQISLVIWLMSNSCRSAQNESFRTNDGKSRHYQPHYLLSRPGSLRST